MAKKDTHDYTPHGGKHLMIADNSEGYEKLGDQIWPARCSASAMEEIVSRQAGLDAYVQSTNRYVVEQFCQLAADNRRWWDWAVKAYGLDPEKVYRWHTADHRIEPVPEPSKEEVK